MYSLIRFGICILAFHLCGSATGQQNIDSLLREIKKEHHPDSLVWLQLKTAIACQQQGQVTAGLEHAEAALRISRALHKDSLIAHSHKTIGYIYFTSENAPAAVDHYNKALNYAASLLPVDAIHCWNALGILYSAYSEWTNAIESYRNAIELIPALEPEIQLKYDYLYNNLAIVFTDDHEFDSAWFYHQKCLAIRTEKGDGRGMGQSYNNIGTLYYEIEEYDSSLRYFQIGLAFRDTTTGMTPSAIIESKVNIGKALVGLKRFTLAEKILNETLQWAIDFSNPKLEMNSLEQLMECYAQTGKYQKAYECCRNYFEMRDNLYGWDKREEMIRLSHQNLYQQKLEHDSTLVAEQDRAARLQSEKEKEIQEHRDSISLVVEIGLTVGFLIALALLIVAWRSYKNKKKAAEEIRIQKGEAEHQRDIAEEQKRLLQVVNQEITDSIHYAKRIQKAILPADNTIQRILQKYFVLYKPKAIVAGDFYWLHEADGLCFFAAADCTGHGVPGALVSVICSTALNRCVDEYHLRDPAEILDKAADLIIETFEKSGEKVRDGMDISLCAFDRKKKELVFCGANNPIFVARSGSAKVERFQPSRQAVGFVDRRTKFTSQRISFAPGDTVYSFTDGFTDQFGGPMGKKYKASRLLTFISTLSGKSMAEQGKAFEKELSSWMGEYEQIDDICVLGFRM